MIENTLIIVLISVYLGIILGIILKCYELKAKNLYLFAILISIFLLVFILQQSLSVLKDKNNNIIWRIKNFGETLIYSISIYPIMVDSTIKILSISPLINKGLFGIIGLFTFKHMKDIYKRLSIQINTHMGKYHKIAKA